MKMPPLLRRLILVLALVATPAAADCTYDPLAITVTAEDMQSVRTAAQAVPFPEGNLWRAEKDGSVVHVVGTLHIADRRHDRMVEAVAPAIRGADLLVLEVTRERQEEVNSLMVERPEQVFIMEGPTLIDLLPEAEWRVLTEKLSARGIPGFMAAKFQPWFAAIFLSIPDCAFRTLSTAPGLDHRLEEIALAEGVRRESLDSAEILVSLFQSSPVTEQLGMLREAIAQAETSDATFGLILELYFEGRHREVFELSRTMMTTEGFEDFESALLTERNLAWAEQLPALLSGRNAVIAVGAAHLSGETGVLQKLEDMGYRLKRL